MSLSQLPSSDVRAALVEASRCTGASLSWLTVVGGAESCFQANAKCSTSSATGLFQFTEQGWFSALAKFGNKHGLDDLTQRLREGKHGGYTPKDPHDREAILALRRDPRLNALMAAELAQESRANLKAALHRQPTQGELYLAHFLGPGDAIRFIHQRDATPDGAAADLFPKAAKANHEMFFHTDGTPVTFAEMDERFAHRFQHANHLVAQVFPDLAPAEEPRGRHRGASLVAEKLADRRRHEAAADHPGQTMANVTPQPMGGRANG